MWITILQLGVLAAVTLIQRYSASSSPKAPGRARDHRFDYPKSAEGTAVPIVYGRVRISQPLIAWWGRAVETTDTTLGVSRYSIAILFDLGSPPVNSVDGGNFIHPTIHKVFIGDVAFPVSGLDANTSSLSYWSAPFIFDGFNWQPLSVENYLGSISTGFGDSNLFGGPGQGGGFKGVLEFWRGTPDQTITGSTIYTNPFQGINITGSDHGPATIIEKAFNSSSIPLSDIPGYRNQMLCLMVADIGENSQLPDISFELSAGLRTTTDGSGGTVLATDCNPADVLYDLITGTLNGKLGISPSLVDNTSFTLARTTLFAENHGIGMVLTDTKPASEVINEILSQIGGVIFIDDSAGGLWKIKLLRNDYSIPSIPYLTVYNCEKISDHDISHNHEIYNQVRVAYTNRERGYTTDYVTEQNMAHAGGQSSRIRTTERSYPGIMNAGLAKTIAKRDLNAVSQPIFKCRVYMNRDGLNLLPGDPVQFAWDPYGIPDTICRVLAVDTGTGRENTMIVDIVKDVFSDYNSIEFQEFELFVVDPEPVTDKLIIESPRFWNLKAGRIADNNHLMGFVQPDAYAEKGNYISQEVTNFGFGFSESEVPVRDYRLVGYLTNPILRESDPTPTATYIDFIAFEGHRTRRLGEMILVGYTPTQIGVGKGMFVVGVNGRYEFISAQNATNMGAGVYRLSNIYRGLLDTPTISHAVGIPIYEVDAEFVGYRTWNKNDQVLTYAIPAFNSVDAVATTITIQERSSTQYPVANLAAYGYNITGTQGAPAVADRFKSVALLEEGISFSWVARERTNPNVSSGLSVSEALSVAQTYSIKGKKYYAGSLVEFSNSGGTSDGNDTCNHLGLVGHGPMSLEVTPRTSYYIPGDLSLSYRDSLFPTTLDVTAPRWRNLVSNCRFDSGNFTQGGWTVTGGAVVSTGVDSLTKSASGTYANGGTTTNLSTISKIIDIEGYDPVNLTARVRFYYRNTGADTDDTVSCLIESLNSSLTVVSSATFPATGGINTYYRVGTVSLANLGSTVRKIRITFTLTGVANGTPGARITIGEVQVRVGTYQHNVLLNSDFSSGVGTNWTAIVNSFVNNSAVPYISTSAAQGGAFSSSEIAQVYTIPTGYFWGSVVVWFARANSIASDTGNVIVEIKNSGGTVIATRSTGLESFATLNVWNRRRLVIDDIPKLAVSVTVRLVANRTLGAGNSGALFDDIVVDIHKHLDPVEEITYDFSYIREQKLPKTWGEFHTTYPTIWPETTPQPGIGSYLKTSDGHAANMTILGGSETTTPGFAWTALASYGKAVFPWGATSCYEFVRSGPSGASDLVCTSNRTATPKSGEAFTYFCIFRIDEPTFATTTGLLGRKGTRGWVLDITSAGNLRAELYGSLGTKSVTRSTDISTVADGSWHFAAISYDPTLNLLYVQDERGEDSISTASGLGEFRPTDGAFRIGRSSGSHQTLPGQIARVYCFKRKLTAVQIKSLFSAMSPSTFNLDVTSTYWGTDGVVTDGLDDADGAVVLQYDRDKPAITYHPGIASWGWVHPSARTNLIPSFDTSNATYWLGFGSPTTTQEITDPRGLKRGIRVAVTGSSMGLRINQIPLSATTKVKFTFWGRKFSGSTALDLELQNSSNVVKNTQSVILTDSWKKFEVSFTSWDASSATAKIAFKCVATSVFDISGFCYADQEDTFAVAYPSDAASGIVPHAIMTLSGPTAQINDEGEIQWDGVGNWSALPLSTLANLYISANENRRVLKISGNQPVFDHYDSASAVVTTTGLAVTGGMSVLQTIRARWNQAVVKPPTGTAGIVDSAGEVYGRNASWTTNTNALKYLEIGSSVGSDTVVKKVVLRTTAQKLSNF